MQITFKLYDFDKRTFRTKTKKKKQPKKFPISSFNFFSLAAAAAVASDDGHDGMLAIALAMRWLEACFVDSFLVLLYVGCSAFTILRLGLVILN